LQHYQLQFIQKSSSPKSFSSRPIAGKASSVVAAAATVAVVATTVAGPTVPSHQSLLQHLEVAYFLLQGVELSLSKHVVDLRPELLLLLPRQVVATKVGVQAG